MIVPQMVLYHQEMFGVCDGDGLDCKTAAWDCCTTVWDRVYIVAGLIPCTMQHSPDREICDGLRSSVTMHCFKECTGKERRIGDVFHAKVSAV